MIIKLPRLLRKPVRKLFSRASPIKRADWSERDLVLPPRAGAVDMLGRFREIVADPLNLLIEREPLSGCVVGGQVVLHNGIRVDADGRYAYYGDFSQILLINRGVHEPLEEYAFQEVLRCLPPETTMLELGAYWGHYSMWCQKVLPHARLWLVEPSQKNLDVARKNFATNGMQGTFIENIVAPGRFEVDRFMEETRLQRLNILHADIQGFEEQMLDGADQTLRKGAVDWLFISTHSDTLHGNCCTKLREFGYKVSVDANWGTETTSHDGFILAQREGLPDLFHGKRPLGRLDLVRAKPHQIVESLNRISNHDQL